MADITIDVQVFTDTVTRDNFPYELFREALASVGIFAENVVVRRW